MALLEFHNSSSNICVLYHSNYVGDESTMIFLVDIYFSSGTFFLLLVNGSFNEEVYCTFIYIEVTVFGTGRISPGINLSARQEGMINCIP